MHMQVTACRGVLAGCWAVLLRLLCGTGGAIEMATACFELEAGILSSVSFCFGMGYRASWL
jgi:hypothetical protein